ncbi:hypothetical protein JTB14_021179 [Gonioctena quinquepunctata]|nr:hypothetical protein JTB14_021179 [Gonioctena quinquepunctata]
MFQVTIDDMLLTVDEETAEQLKDPEYAANYATTFRRELLNQDTRSAPHQPNEKSRLWKSPKCPTEEDHKATLALLAFL